MKIKGIQWVSLGLLCLAVIQTSAMASPAWRTTPPGQAPTTYQSWAFEYDPANPSGVPAIGTVLNAEVDNNIYGTATAIVNVVGEVTENDFPGWRPGYAGHLGYWHGETATVTLTIPNNPVANLYKEIWVEVGCRGHLVGETYDGDGYSLGTGYTVMDPVNSTFVEDLGFVFTETGDGWRKLVFGLRIYPNPASETIRFTLLNTGADIDYIIVDTICIPEPMTLVLLGLGGMLCAKLKRL